MTCRWLHEVLCVTEQIGGNNREDWTMEGFREAVDECCFSDLGYSGLPRHGIIRAKTTDISRWDLIEGSVMIVSPRLSITLICSMYKEQSQTIMLGFQWNHRSGSRGEALLDHSDSIICGRGTGATTKWSTRCGTQPITGLLKSRRRWVGSRRVSKVGAGKNLVWSASKFNRFEKNWKVYELISSD